MSKSFLRVLRPLRNGTGPQTAFRAYALSTLRRVSSKAVTVSAAAMAAIVGGVSLNSVLNATAAPTVPLSVT